MRTELHAEIEHLRAEVERLQARPWIEGDGFSRFRVPYLENQLAAANALLERWVALRARQNPYQAGSTLLAEDTSAHLAAQSYTALASTPLEDRIALAIKYLTDGFKAPEEMRSLALDALKGVR